MLKISLSIIVGLSCGLFIPQLLRLNPAYEYSRIVEHARNCGGCICQAASMRQADYVFVGSIRGVEERRTGDAEYSYDLYADVQVEKVIAGRLELARVTLKTATTGCGSLLEVGKHYMIFAHKLNALFYTDDCTGTRPIAAEEQTISAIVGQPAYNQPAHSDEGPGN
jgi:hypothetical protein